MQINAILSRANTLVNPLSKIKPRHLFVGVLFVINGRLRWFIVERAGGTFVLP